MAETKPLTAYWMHDVIRSPEPLTIGKHAWRLVQYRGLENHYVIDEATGIGRLVEMPAIFADYEWRRLDERFEHWRQARDWPRYDFNDGQHRGPPRSLRKLYDACPWGPPGPRPTAPVPRRRAAITSERDPLERPDDNPRAKLPAATQPKGQ